MPDSVGYPNPTTRPDAHPYICLNIYSDSKVAIQLLAQPLDALHPLAVLICQVLELKHSFDECVIVHVLRECNKVADRLAKHGASIEDFFTTWAFPPDFVLRDLAADASGRWWEAIGVRPRLETATSPLRRRLHTPICPLGNSVFPSRPTTTAHAPTPIATNPVPPVRSPSFLLSSSQSSVLMDANSDSNLGVPSRSSTCDFCHRILSSDNETGDLEAISVCGDCKFLLFEDIEIASPDMQQTRAPASRRRFRYSSSESIESIFSQQLSQVITPARPNRSNVSEHDIQSIDGEGAAARLVRQSSSRTTPSGSRRLGRVFSDNDSVSDGFDSLFGESESTIGFRRYTTFHGEVDTMSNSVYDGDSDVSADGQSIFGNENFGRPTGGSDLETDTDIDPMNAGRYPWNSEIEEEQDDSDSDWEALIDDVNPQVSLGAIVARHIVDDYRRRQSLFPEIEGGFSFRVRERRVQARSVSTTGFGELMARSRARDSVDYLDSRGFENLHEHLAEADNSRRGVPPASMSFVNNMPCLTINEKDVDSMMACAICKDSFIVGTVVKQLPCCHLYHPACIYPWLSAKNTCPLCRYELPTDDYDYEARKRNREAAMGNEYRTHDENDDSSSSSDDAYDDDDDDDVIVVVYEPSQQEERIDAADSGGGECRTDPGDGAITRNRWFLAAAAPIISILGMSLIMWFQTNRRSQRSHIPHRGEYSGQKRWWWQQPYL